MRKLTCVKERANRTWFLANPDNRATDSRLQVGNGVRTEIGQLAIVEVIPMEKSVKKIVCPFFIFERQIMKSEAL